MRTLERCCIEEGMNTGATATTPFRGSESVGLCVEDKVDPAVLLFRRPYMYVRPRLLYVPTADEVG